MLIIAIAIAIAIALIMWILCAAGKDSPQYDTCKYKEICENDNESYFCCWREKEDDDK